MLYQTLSHTLKLAPHESPSSQPLTKNPQQLCYFLCKTLTKDPQQVWQTLNNFDYPTNLYLAHRIHKKGRMPPGMHPIVRFIVIFCLQHWVYFILFAVEMQGKITSLFSLASLLLLLSKHQQDYRH